MRPLRRKLLRARVLIPLAAVVALALWVWHPWQPRIVIHERINPKDGVVMVWVPAGTFRMGTSRGDMLRRSIGENDLTEARKVLSGQTPTAFLGETPAHTVYLDGYWIYKNEVTVAQYRQFCRTTGRAMPEKPSWGWQDNHPIVNVDWHDAAAYATWAGASLPTEAQWEKAARGPDGRRYPWGNVWDSMKCCNAVGKHTLKPSPVGSFPEGVSPYGAQDMAGNVWEWCADWHDRGYYKYAPRRNPVGPATGSMRAMRGDSWDYLDPVGFRAAVRARCSPTYRGASVGFRCVVRSSGP
ncbi:MAG: formylglycine-generating enzyme family protein [Armatimonadota bacterium]